MISTWRWINTWVIISQIMLLRIYEDEQRRICINFYNTYPIPDTSDSWFPTSFSFSLWRLLLVSPWFPFPQPLNGELLK